MSDPTNETSEDHQDAAHRSRRSLLGAMLGGVGAWVAAGLTRVSPATATPPPALAGADNLTRARTGFINQNTAGSTSRELDALYGKTNAPGTGVKGEGKYGVLGISTIAGAFGVWGQHTGSGHGLNGDSASGAGVHGKSTTGYGGLLEGGKAQLRLIPKGSTGRPTTGSHSRGELYLDSVGSLFICVAGGSPGTWRKVTTTAA